MNLSKSALKTSKPSSQGSGRSDICPAVRPASAGLKAAFLTVAAVLASACGAVDQAHTAMAPVATPTPVSANPSVQTASRTVAVVPASKKDDLTAHLYQNEAAFPACDTERQGSLAYSAAARTMHVCDATVWTLVETVGKDGKAGAAGKDGAPGAAGRDGSQGATGANGQIGAQGVAGRDGTDALSGVSRIYTCQGYGAAVSGSSTVYMVDYEAVTYRTGEVRVSAHVNAEGSGTGGSGSKTWVSGQAGAAAGQVTVALQPVDMPGAYRGELTLRWEVGHQLRAWYDNGHPGYNTGATAPGWRELGFACSLQTF